MLAAIRCLGQAGFEVTAVADTGIAPGMWSRAAVEHRPAPDPRVSVGDFVARLEAIVSERHYDLLVPGTDISLLTVSSERHRLAPHVDLGLPPHEIVERALDRKVLAQEAAHVELASPDARVCERPEDALDAALSFGYPVLVKPSRIVREIDGGMQRFASVLAHDPPTVTDAAGEFGTCIVQRCATGPVISFGGVVTDDGLLAFVVSRYLRTWPPEAGNVCFSETIVPPVDLAERVQALAARIGWVGLFELELIEQPDGSLAAIDFNPRAYGSMTLAAAAGVPLSALWCSWALGDQPGSPSARAGVRYRWEDADFRHCLWQLRHGRIRAAASVLRPHREVTHAYFQARDPAPLIARGAQLVRLARNHRRQKLPSGRFATAGAQPPSLGSEGSRRS